VSAAARIVEKRLSSLAVHQPEFTILVRKVGAQSGGADLRNGRLFPAYG
jgi:hypothetical protein